MLDATENQRLCRLYEKLRLKLLDLSLKNPMLNYRLGAKSKRQIQIVDEVLEEVYKRLIEKEASLRVLPLDDPDDIPADETAEDFIAALEHAKVSDIEYLTRIEALESQGRDDELALDKLERELRDKVRSQLGLPPRPRKTEINRAECARSRGIDPNTELPANRSKESHSDDALQTLKFPDELERIMDKIADDARLAEQEMGLSTLFLAFGFLEWYQSDDSDKKSFAPLLLLPVKLESEKARGQESFYLTAQEHAAETNLSLQKLLEENFNRKLPDFEEEEESASVQEYLTHVQTAIEGLPRWQVHRWLVLGHFAFGRFAMYADLSPENWATGPVEHSLVSSILRGTEDPGGGGALPSIPDDYSVDEPEFEKIAPFLIQDADASQHSALIDVMQGKNLVIQGPPGTGKSQTICNVIANALAADKTVLFLAEKQAALDVVKRRLTSAGLGEFCLELHSDKSSPKLVVTALKERAEIGSKGAKRTKQPTDVQWYDNRNELKAYADALHTEQADGHTLFRLIWKALRGRSANRDITDEFKSVPPPEELLSDLNKRRSTETSLKLFADVSASFVNAYGHPASSPWAKIKLADIAGQESSYLIDALQELTNVSTNIAEFMDSVTDLGVAKLEDISRLVEVDAALDEPPATDLLPRIAALDPDALDAFLESTGEWHRAKRALAEQPNLSNESAPKLAIASGLMQAELPPEFCEHTPAELYELASNTIDRDTEIIKLIERFLPILRLFELDFQLPASALLPLAVAVQAGAKIPPAQRAWIGAHRDLNASEFWRLNDVWRSVATSEAKWRTRLPQYGARQWPESDKLQRAAFILRKSGIAKAVAALTRATKTACMLVDELGLQTSPDTADDLDSLAGHVRALRIFEADQAAAGLLGSSWNGLSTPFEEIGAGLKLRELFLKRIGTLTHGREIAERLVKLAPESYASLAEPKHLEPAVALSSAPHQIRSQLDDRSIERLLVACRDKIATMQKGLTLDPSRSLIDIRFPVRQIAEIAALRTHCESLRRKMEASPVREAAHGLARTPEECLQVTAASNWVRAVNSSNPPNEMRTKLLSANASEQRARLRQVAEHGAELTARYTQLTARLADEFGITELNTRLPKDLAAQATALINHADELSDFLSLTRQRNILAASGLGPFLARADELMLDPTRLPGLLETLIAYRSAGRIRSTPVFARNSGALLDARRQHFQDADRRKIKSDRSSVRTKLLQRRLLPGSNYGSKKEWTEMALLNNEFAKQKGFRPVRSLVARAGRSIQALKPCFMMSPLSLAKFIPAASLDFDLLVIDEASQMKPEDALGGMLRAKQIVVVGDQKQLPPTDFFSRSAVTADDDDFDDIDDESILEGCQKTFREVRRLKWHYRSQCESLIRFSNENFYNDSPLITFPAAKPGSFSIDLVRVNGAYQARRNVAEASRVAECAIEFMRHYASINENEAPTLGIVAMNTDQRDLIREELRRISADDALVEQYMEKMIRRDEPFFVKNLENVQGDERDFIFISLTYGREPGATVLKQRFGPINGKQGHRRLNVLFTRARMRIGLFTSFGSSDVLPADTSSEGVRVLKQYLEYAESRGHAPVEKIGGNAESDFEIEVADRLRTRGYTVEPQVGVSGYRIDIGVRHPDHPEHFLAGVECDGASYHSSKSARDRDRIREEVLRSKGWSLVRVWSTDWFENPARETDKLVRKLDELRSAKENPDEYSLGFAAPISQRIDSPEDRAVEINQECSAAASQVEAAPPLSSAGAMTGESSLPSSQAPFTRADGIKALGDFRANVIRAEMPNWEPHRSILRDAMIETFVSQHITDPDEWFTKVPRFLRQGTNPIEKKYLEQICEIVDRIEVPYPTSSSAETFRLTSPGAPSKAGQMQLPLGAGLKSSNPPVPEPVSSRNYVITDFSAGGLRPNPSRFYDHDYRNTLHQMIELVLQTEGPIYEDVLVDRIARAHGFQRSGNNIHQIIGRLVRRKITESKEDDRIVLWPEGMRPDTPVSYRQTLNGVRSHTDIPVAELAGLARPLVSRGMSDEEALRSMGSHFQLGRIRESTRARFEKAIKLARRSPP